MIMNIDSIKPLYSHILPWVQRGIMMYQSLHFMCNHVHSSLIALKTKNYDQLRWTILGSFLYIESVIILYNLSVCYHYNVFIKWKLKSLTLHTSVYLLTLLSIQPIQNVKKYRIRIVKKILSFCKYVFHAGVFFFNSTVSQIFFIEESK